MIESFVRSLDTGLPDQYEVLHAVVTKTPGKRLYERVVERCEQCHSFCTGSQFRESTCAKTGLSVSGFNTPPLSCPLPLV